MTLTAAVGTEAPPESDVAIVGGGILGLAVARELLQRHPGLRLSLFEREAGVGRHQTGHSSGVVHAGIYYRPGSLKARLCVEGARRLYDYCDQRGIPYERPGKLIVAVCEDELARLDELEARGRANGVPGLVRIGADRIPDIEPSAVGLAALHSAGTGVLDFGLVAESLAREVEAAGGAVVLGRRVRSVGDDGDAVAVRHTGGSLRARAVVCCAGGWASAIAGKAEPTCRILPFRGAYLRLRPGRRDLVRSMIYPVPDPQLPFLGAHLTRHIDGEVVLGPTALLAGAPDAYRLWRLSPRSLAQTFTWPGSWRMARRLWRTGVHEIGLAARRAHLVRELARYVPDLRPADVLAGPAGVRAQAVGRDGRLIDDFLIAEAGRTMHVINAPSPAATSALALAEVIGDRLASLAEL